MIAIQAQQQRQSPMDDLQFAAHNDMQIPIGTLVSGSEMTSNAANASRKRARDDCFPMESRTKQSAMTSTSGRSSTLAQTLAMCMYHQNAEIDALIRFQSERLRSGLEEASKRHCRALVMAVEQQARRSLQEKEAELLIASRRNAELEERVRQVAAESQIWFNVARNNEAIVASLRTSLEQVLVQSTCVVGPEEGFGDSHVAAGDEGSCCYDAGDCSGKREAGRGCRVCREEEVCVLLLPCRHLCLCRACESKVDTCPVCGSSRVASMQVFLE